MQKEEFKKELGNFASSLKAYVSTEGDQWSIKGFIDVYKNIYTISADTKIISKILEIHLFPKILEFAQAHSFQIELTTHQNYYPDISFVDINDPSLKYAVDLKTTYRLSEYEGFCNGFTLGSHGEYFINRSSTKNIQFPYKDYTGHFILGIIYTRALPDDIDETKIFSVEDLPSITSVIKDLQFFVCEKWEIASDKEGSANTANIGSITRIEDILNCSGMFKNLGEQWFDDYWMNYGKITVSEGERIRKIKSLKEFIEYRGGDASQINPRLNKRKQKR